MGRPIAPFVLSSADRPTIEALTRKGRHAGRTVQRGRMLLRLADGVSGYTVADELGCCVQTVYQLRRRYVEQGLATALDEAPRSGGPRRAYGPGPHAGPNRAQPLDATPVGRQSRGALAAAYPRAEKIGLVQDNGNIHTNAVFYQHLPAAEAVPWPRASRYATRPKTPPGSTWSSWNYRPSPASACTSVSPRRTN